MQEEPVKTCEDMSKRWAEAPEEDEKSKDKEISERREEESTQKTGTEYVKDRCKQKTQESQASKKTQAQKEAMQ